MLKLFKKEVWLKFLHFQEVVKESGDALNVAISPYTVWSLLSIIAEGARENTARQLENTLKIPQDKTALRKNFQNFSNTVLVIAKDSLCLAEFIIFIVSDQI